MGENKEKNNVKVEWDLSQIYSNIDELKKDIEKELSLTEKMTTFKGKLNNKKDIFEFFKIDEEAELIASKTTAYMALRLQKNMKDLEILKLDSEISPKFKKLSKQLIFVEDAEFERFNSNLRYQFALKGHILTQEQKLLMNHIGSAMNFSNIYDLIENEIRFEKAEDENRKSS